MTPDTEIPADIREKAWKTAEGLEWIGDSVNISRLEVAIAEALMQERERCYKIAISSRSLPSRDMDVYGTTLAIDIATAIRKPPTP